MRGSSFTFVAKVEEWDYESDPNYVIRTIQKGDIYEVATVTNPAFPQSTAGVRSEQDVVEIIRREKEKRQKIQRETLERQRALRDIKVRLG